MVYCNYQEHDQNSVVYLFGAYDSDITGKLRFSFHDDNIEILKKPIGEMAPIRHIERLYRREKGSFLSGRFKEKIAYETA